MRHLWLPHLQLHELRTRLGSAKHILWLWLAIDPLTTILPVLELGPRTHHLAHQVIHSLPQSQAAFLPPALDQWWAQSLLLCGSRLTLVSGEKWCDVGAKPFDGR